MFVQADTVPNNSDEPVLLNGLVDIGTFSANKNNSAESAQDLIARDKLNDHTEFNSTAPELVSSRTVLSFDFSRWLETLESAIRGAWLSRHNMYSRVSVLMLSWDDFDQSRPSLQMELGQLQNVFRELYKFEVKHCIIPLTDPANNIVQQLQQIEQDNRQPNSLTIVYYAGNVRPGSSSDAPPILRPK